MSNTTPNPPLVQKLNNCILELLQSGIELREAICKRSTNDIWEVLARQEEQASLLEEYCQLWEQLQSCHPEGANPELDTIKKKIKKSLIQLQAMQKSNAALAHSFLSAIRNALNSAGKKNIRKSLTYNRLGRRGRKISSVIINSKG